MKVYMTLPKITLHHGGGLEKNKEVYVVSFASDRRRSSSKRALPIGAMNEKVSSLLPSGSEYFVVSVSNIFEGVRKGEPLSLSGDGVILYPPADPKGMLGLYFAVIESDSGSRDVGKMLGNLFEHPQVSGILGEISKYSSLVSSVPVDLLSEAFKAVTTVFPAMLENDKDNVLMSHTHSGVDFNNYGVGSKDVESFSVGNHNISATLRVWVRE